MLMSRIAYLVSRLAPGRSPVTAGLFCALGLLCLALAARAAAHGIGTPQVLNAAAGPYLLSAWTDPDPLRTDETHVVVAVTDPDTREPIITDVEVTVTMTSLDDPAVVLTEVAGTDNVNRLLFAAEFNDRLAAGRWRVDLSATGARGSGEGVSFEVDVEQARGFNWLWLGIGGLAVVVLVWVAGSLRPERGTQRAARPRRRG